jgi:hypothetical protein
MEFAYEIEKDLFEIYKIGLEKFLVLNYKGKEYKTRIPITSDGRIILPSGSQPVFRKTVEITYDDFKPEVKMYQNIEQWIIKDCQDPKLQGYIVSMLKQSEGDVSACENLVRGLLLKSLNKFYKSTTVWEDPGSDFECFAQKLTYVLADGVPPTRRGGFFPDSVTKHRLTFLRALENQGVSSLCATQPGDPGTTADWVDKATGLPVYMGIQPMALECHPMRYAIQRGLTHFVKLQNSEAPFVNVEETLKYPSLQTVNANVICGDLGLNDSVIISQDLADRLTGLEDEVHTHTLDGLITCRGESEPLTFPSVVKRSMLQKTETAYDVFVRYRRLWLSKYGDESKVSQVRKKHLLSVMKTCPLLSVVCPDVQERIHLNMYNCEYGENSSESFTKFRRWLQLNDKYATDMLPFNHLNQPVSRRFPGVGIDRLIAESNSGRSVLYKEFHGIDKNKCRVGAKLQTDADLAKGVCNIFENERMPFIKRADGTMVRADLVVDMAKSTKKHGSLRFAHLTMALYAIGQAKGGITVKVSEPWSDEKIVATGKRLGIYDDESLTCEMWNDTQTHVLGKFPAGVIRIGRHRQDPDIQGGVVGELGKKELTARNVLKESGVRDGFIDTNVQMAFGFIESAKELRRVTPSAKKKVNALERVLVFNN